MRSIFLVLFLVSCIQQKDAAKVALVPSFSIDPSVSELQSPLSVPPMNAELSQWSEADREYFEKIIESPIQSLDSFDLQQYKEMSKSMMGKCQIPRAEPKYFRRPKGGGHRKIYDPSLILGISFDQERCKISSDDPQSEDCMIIRQWMDPAGKRNVLELSLTERTKPFRAVFERVAAQYNSAAKKMGITKGDQRFMHILPEVANTEVDCAKHIIEFVDGLVNDGTRSDGTTLSASDPDSGLILDADMFIDIRRVLRSSFTLEESLSALMSLFSHESGHAYGMRHNRSPLTDSIMNTYPSSDPRFFRSMLYDYDKAVLSFQYTDRYDPALLWQTDVDGNKYLWSLIASD